MANKESKQYTLLRKLLQALGLSAERIDDLIAIIQSWLTTDETNQSESQFPYHIRDNFLSPAELSRTNLVPLAVAGVLTAPPLARLETSQSTLKILFWSYLDFYQVLQTAVSDWAIVLIKVNLGDLFYASTGDYGQNMAYRNRIARKHVDFLLCDPETVRPLLAIELDDSSHNRSDRKERDRFVDGVFAAVRLPLVHVPVSHRYPTRKLRTFLQQKAGVELHGHSPSLDVSVAKKEKTAVPNCPKCDAPMVRRTAQRGASAGNQFWGCSQYPQCRGIRQIEPAA
jgi:hypothetical protein